MKRIFDLIAVITGLLLIWPLIVLLALLVRIKLGAPIFFCQTRPGMGGKPFKMVKFRTMTNERDADGNLLSDAHRLTSFGRFLRSTSLDELPELWNVLKGDMSLVGPRPLLMEYLPYYSEREKRRHLVRPGLTGLAQISGRNNLSWDERLEMDVKYVEEMNFLLDIKILLKTVLKVLLREDVLVVPSKKFGKLDDERRK